tara:strand:+ start:184 stop:657 length:474 start_codon:yes stop_codon:yes gene_type:complete
MKHLLLTTIAAVVLVGCGEAQQSSVVKSSESVKQAIQPQSEEGVHHTIELASGTNLSLEEIQNNRGLPHSYFDQGIDSIPLIHPHHRILVKRRYGRLGQTSYSLIVFLESSTADEVDISGVAVASHKAWVYHTKTDLVSMTATLQLVNEKLSQLSTL